VRNRPPVDAGVNFLVSLPDGGWGSGVVGAVDRSVVVGHFFDVIFDTPPDKLSAADLVGVDLVMVAQYSILGLRNLDWPIVGRIDPFRAERWPAFTFSMEALLAPFGQLAEYSGSFHGLGELSKIPKEEISKHPSNALYDCESLERELSAVLHRKVSPMPTHRDLRWRFSGDRYIKELPL